MAEHARNHRTRPVAETPRSRERGDDDRHIEAALVRAAALGDRLSFRALYERSAPRAYRFALSLVRRPDLAEELVQEAFCQAWAGLRRFEGQARFDTWLLRIVRNAALDALRRERTRREADRERIAERLQPPPAPETPLHTRELHEAVERALAELPEPTRSAFSLAAIERLPYGEIARLLDTTTDGVKCRVYRAREHLRRRLRRFRTPPTP